VLNSAVEFALRLPFSEPMLEDEGEEPGRCRLRLFIAAAFLRLSSISEDGRAAWIFLSNI
jgi:hypothetical protein